MQIRFEEEVSSLYHQGYWKEDFTQTKISSNLTLEGGKKEHVFLMLKDFQNIMIEILWKFEETIENNFFILISTDFPVAFCLPEKIEKVIHQVTIC